MGFIGISLGGFSRKWRCYAGKNASCVLIGADFNGAMVATAPGEKLLTGRRPLRKWTRRTISGLFLCRKLHLFFGKSTKTAAIRAALFGSNMYQIVCPLGLHPIPHWGACSAPSDPLAVFRGPRGRERRGKERKGRGGERSERGFVLCPRKKKEKSTLMVSLAECSNAQRSAAHV